MSPIYDDGVSAPATEPVATGWRTRVEYHALAEVQPETIRRVEGFPTPERKPMRIDWSYADSREHRLNLHIKRTGETFNDVFRAGPLMYDDALSEIDHMLRDWRRDEVVKIDRELIDLLSMVQEEIGFGTPITVVSGYRSAATNRMLRRRMRGVAKNSYHTRGMAVDIRLPGVSTNTLRTLGLKMKAGGVGYYPRAGFVHLDTGPVRSWRA
jgi:uncharacterized protein YcbK (DUF882 family)